MLLQVLRVRHPPGPHPSTGRGRAAARGGGAAQCQGAAGADRRATRGQPRGRRPPGRVGPPRLHLLRGLGLRAGARAGHPAAHQPRRSLPRGPLPPEGGDGLAGTDARVERRATDGDRARRLPDQAPGPPPGDDRCGRGAAHPLHQRHPGRDRRDRGGAGRLAGGDRGLTPPPRPHPGGDHPKLRPAPALLRGRGSRDRRPGHEGEVEGRRITARHLLRFASGDAGVGGRGGRSGPRRFPSTS